MVAFVCCFSLGSVMSEVSAADNALLSVTSAERDVGDTVQIDVNLTEVSSLAGGTFDIFYDPALLRPLADGIKAGELIKGFYFMPNPNNETSQGKSVRVVFANSKGSSGSGRICSVQFQLLKPGTAILGLKDYSLKDSKLKAIPCSVADGTVRVLGDDTGAANPPNNTHTNPADTGNPSTNDHDQASPVTNQSPAANDSADHSGSAAAGSSTNGTSVPGSTADNQLNPGSSSLGSSNHPSGSDLFSLPPPREESSYPGLKKIREAAAKADAAAVMPAKNPIDISGRSSANGHVLQDISRHWAKDYIEKLVAAGVLSGYPDSTFQPDKTISRAEFACIISRAFQLPAGNSTPGFKDWSDISQWAQAGIAAAAQAGIINGYEDGSFRPDQPVSRSEMVVMIMKARHKEAAANGPASFSDNAQIPAWAQTYVQEAVKCGIISGKGQNQFKPHDKTTRAEAAVILAKTSGR